eukprot:TRINITY_DN15434_c2_g1_i2.p1 TRINITY_DN15434_c2_g1~~TRINITY_DN15434_c2_g1_i2.p1  ORF type:complete len:221 (+),score=18.59 TRINITY_DN15434_c2_g1_i2:50-712(+)
MLSIARTLSSRIKTLQKRGARIISVRSMSGQQRDRRLVNISKEMSKILRHHPPPSIDESGWVNVDELISTMKGKVTFELIQQVVQTDEKGRFDLDNNANPARIRATQGHTIQLETPVLEKIVSVDQVPCAVHVTSRDGWASIQQSGQLLRMDRTHIHFATEAVHLRKNSWAKVFLKLNIEKALEDGIQLWRSTNGVLLAEGPIPVSYLAELDGVPKELLN